MEATALLHSSFQGEAHSILNTQQMQQPLFFPPLIKIHNYFQGLMFLFNSAVFYKWFLADHFIPIPAQPGCLEAVLRTDLCMEHNLHSQSCSCVPTDHLKEGNKTLMPLVKQ